MGSNARIPTVRPDDWVNLNRVLRKLSFSVLGADSSPTFADVTLTDLTAVRLVATDASKKLISSDLVNWVAGTANRVTVTDDADGTITLSGPQDIHTGASPTFAGLTLNGNLDMTGDDIVNGGTGTFDFLRARQFESHLGTAEQLLFIVETYRSSVAFRDEGLSLIATGEITDTVGIDFTPYNNMANVNLGTAVDPFDDLYMQGTIDLSGPHTITGGTMTGDWTFNGDDLTNIGMVKMAVASEEVWIGNLADGNWLVPGGIAHGASTVNMASTTSKLLVQGNTAFMAFVDVDGPVDEKVMSWITNAGVSDWQIFSDALALLFTPISIDMTNGNIAFLNTSIVGTLGVTGITTLTGLIYPSADGSASDIIKTDGAGTLSLVTPTSHTQVSFSMYDAEPARGSETSLAGAFLSLATAQPLNSVPTNLVVTKGTGKLVVVVNAGSDFAGDITVTGTSVDRDTGATTGADTDTLTIDALTTDGSDTDTNGNTRHAFTGAYITSKWFVGTVTLSTTNLTLTDVDVYHVSFEQYDDTIDITLDTFDANILTTNVNAEFDAYLYAIMVTGDKCNITREASLNVGVDGETALVNKYWRLRRGNINKAIDGSTDGTWVDVHYSNSPAYVEDVSIKVWATEVVPLTLT